MMGGGAGHMQDMINKIKSNQALRASRRQDKKKSFGTESGETKLKFKKISTNKLNELKLQYQKDAEKENRKQTAILIISFVVTIIGVVWYINQRF